MPTSTDETQPLLPTNQTRVEEAGAKLKQFVPSQSTRFSFARAIGALQEGKLPSQEQLNKILDALVNSDILKSSSPHNRTVRLSDQGAQTVEDIKGLLIELRHIGIEKNHDNQIQEFLHTSSQVDFDVDIHRPSTSSRTKRQAAADAHKAIHSLRAVGQLVLTSVESRELFSHFVLVSRDILADSLKQVARTPGAVAETARSSEKGREQGTDWVTVKKKPSKAKAGYGDGPHKSEISSRTDGLQEPARQYADEKLSENAEAKDRVIERLKAIVSQTQRNPEYLKSVQTIVTLIQNWFCASKDLLKSTADGSKIKGEDEHAKEALTQFKTVLERFAGQSLDPVIEAASKAFQYIQSDDRLLKYFDDVGAYLDRILYDEGWITTHRSYRRGTELYDRGQELIKSDAKWKEAAETLQEQLEAFADAILEDEATERVLNRLSDVSSSFSSLASTAGAQLRFGGLGVVRDAFDVILPRIISAICEIPLPRTEYKSEEIDIAIDDLVFESASFIPDNIRFVAHNDLSMTQGFAAFSTDLDSSVNLHVDGLRLSAKDISYWFHKKKGYFAYEDSGLADIAFKGRGLSFDVKLENAPETARETFFIVSTVEIDLSALEFHVKKNSHWFLSFFGKPFIRSLIENNLRVLLEGQIASYLRTLDLRLFGLQQRAIAATNARPSHPSDYLRAIFSTSAFQPPFTTTSTRKTIQSGIVKTGPRGSYVLAIGVDEMLFPGKAITRKEGDSWIRDTVRGAADGTRQTKKEADELDHVRRDAARREARKDGWRSNAFDIQAHDIAVRG